MGPAGASALLDVYRQIDLEPVRGDGAWLFTADGRGYIDFYGGHAVALLGYGHPRWIAALERKRSEPGRRITALPDLRHRPPASAVTFGRLS